ncbi:MAG: hypothetical protein PHR25_04050 [Clostridia bacterium]|nr:hypothetical protein [Clostridia bacterium]MDD4375935.1 hypothetical protein [Clostridia bacterium]
MMFKQKKGISLIVLVITIIVIVVLASAIILSITSPDIISKAKYASFKNDMTMIKQYIETEMLYDKVSGENLSKYEGFEDLDIDPKYKEIIGIKDGKIYYIKDKVTDFQKDILEEIGIYDKNTLQNVEKIINYQIYGNTIYSNISLLKNDKQTTSPKIDLSWSNIGKIELTAKTIVGDNNIIISTHNKAFIGINKGEWAYYNGTAQEDNRLELEANMTVDEFINGEFNTVTFNLIDAARTTDYITFIWDSVWSKKVEYKRIKFYDRAGELIADLIPIEKGVVINNVECFQNTLYNIISKEFLPIYQINNTSIKKINDNYDITEEDQTPKSKANILNFGEKGNIKITTNNGKDLSNNYNITLSEPLRKLGEAVDYIDFLTRKVIRNVGVIEILPEYDWRTESINYWINNIASKSNAMGSYSSHFKWVELLQSNSINTVRTGGNGNGNLLFNYNNGIDINLFKNFLQKQKDKGDPVVVYYKLKSPTYEDIELPTITPYKDVTKIIIDGGIESSDFIIKY